jgi:hypothetical protein
MLTTAKDAGNYRLAYIAEYLSDRTADCTWLLWENPTLEQLCLIGDALGTDVVPTAQYSDIIQDLYDYVLQMEEE